MRRLWLLAVLQVPARRSTALSGEMASDEKAWRAVSIGMFVIVGALLGVLFYRDEPYFTR